MNINTTPQCSFFPSRRLGLFGLCSVAVLLGCFSLAATAPLETTQANTSTPVGSPASGWTIVSSPNSSATEPNFLYGVTCASASDCWTVGYYRGFGDQTLTEHWDGSSWKIVSSANSSTTQNNELNAVTCVSPSNCWAVGRYSNGSVGATLTQRWDGTSWTIVSSPNPDPLIVLANELDAVTCASASDCWAVGHSYNRVVSAWQTLIERWNGSSWSIVTSPNSSPTQGNFLAGVTCTSSSNCWAVGYHGVGGVLQTLILRWDGSSWASFSSPNTSPTHNNQLTAVTCNSASDCWVAGQYNPGGAWQTLIEHWDGNAWSIVSSPNTSTTQGNFLSSVACASESNCWAVGSYFGSSSTVQTLSLRWDGASWAMASSPNTSASQNNALYGVTCVATGDCWSVGQYNADGVGQTLVLRHAASTAPTPVSVVSRKTHGLAGEFDIELPITGDPGIECRQGQGTNSDEHQVVLTFTAPASVTAAACDGKPAATTSSGNDVTVNCAGVTNAKRINVTLTGVTVGTSSGDVTVRMAVLLGDTTGNGAVNSSDIGQTKSQSGQEVTASNFRQDVIANGSINSSDISLVKSKSGTALP